MSPRKKAIEENLSDVTVIVPVLDRREMVLGCLESIRRQDYRPLDVVVVDNGSGDGTPEAVADFIESIEEDDLNVRLVYCLNRGAARARNHGARVSHTPYIIFFDSDDEMHPRLVSEAMRRFHENTELDIVHWRCRCINESGLVTLKRYTESKYWERQIFNSMLSTQSYAVRRNFFDTAGGWNERLSGWDDWELGIRLLCNSPRIAGIPEALADIHVHADSITGKDFSSRIGEWERAIYASEEDVIKFVDDEAERNRLRRMLAYICVVLAAHYRREGERNMSQGLLTDALHVQKDYWKYDVQRECSEKGRLLSFRDRILFRFLYHYTRLGGRGGYRLVESL